MEKYKIVQLCDGITQEQASDFISVLNSEKYFIYKEYKFNNNAVIILKLIEKEGITVEIDRDKIVKIIEQQQNNR